jgi:hypothetical protein
MLRRPVLVEGLDEQSAYGLDAAENAKPVAVGHGAF